MFEGLHAMIGGRPFALQWSATLIQALANGLIGVAAFMLVERGPGRDAAPADEPAGRVRKKAVLRL